MLGYANVKGDKNSNQRNVDTTQKKKNPNQNQHQQNIEGMHLLAVYKYLLMIAHQLITFEYSSYSNLWKTNSARLDIVYLKHRFSADDRNQQKKQFIHQSKTEVYRHRTSLLAKKCTCARVRNTWTWILRWRRQKSWAREKLNSSATIWKIPKQSFKNQSNWSDNNIHFCPVFDPHLTRLFHSFSIQFCHFKARLHWSSYLIASIKWHSKVISNSILTC